MTAHAPPSRLPRVSYSGSQLAFVPQSRRPCADGKDWVEIAVTGLDYPYSYAYTISGLTNGKEGDNTIANCPAGMYVRARVCPSKAAREVWT